MLVVLVKGRWSESDLRSHSESDKLMLLRLSGRAERRLLENPNGTVLRTFLALPGASCNAHTWNKADEHLNSHKEHYRRDTLS